MIDVLQYWHIEEFLLPQKLEDVDKINGELQQAFRGSLNEIFPKIDKLRKENEKTIEALKIKNEPKNESHAYVWEFVIYGGIYKQEKIKDILLEVLNVSDDEFEERPLTGNAASYVLSFNLRLDFKIDGIQISTAPWAIKDIIKNKKLSQLHYDAFNKIHEYMKEHLNGLATQKDYTFEKFVKDIDKYIKEQLGTNLLEKDDYYQVVATQKKLKNIQPDVTETDMLNSFYIEDLDKTIEYLEDGHTNQLLNQYLEMDTESERVDIRKDIDYVYDMLSPDKLPDACWATAGGYPLVYSQQFAINSIKEKILGNGGIYAVNGPPGTGKTTLLRDLIAMVVTQRAKEIVKLSDPKELFEFKDKINAWETKEGKRGYYKLKDVFLGHEIVVASSNNGAVENVTKEIPLRESIDEKWLDEIDFFRDWGSDLIGVGKDAWGSGAACLGNSKNKNEFISTFYSKKKENEFDGFYNYLQALTKEKINDKKRRVKKWRDSKESFLKALNDVEKFKKEQKVLKKEIDKLKTSITKQKKNAEVLEKLLVELQKKKLSIFSIILEKLLFSRKSHKEKISEYQFELRSSENHLRDLEKEYIEKLAIYSQFENRIEDDEEEREKSSPWTHDENFQEARSRVFVEALNLHKALIDANAFEIRNNLWRVEEVLTNKIGRSTQHEEAVQHAWATLFLCVPVVSTTFASFSRLFPQLWDNKIGWLLIDEAGQASAKQAVGAIMRSKRVVVVGDPLQLEPITGLPGSIQKILHEEIGAHKDSLSDRTSVQKRADFTEVHGTYLESDEGEDIWVGSPLRVHRRCCSPMFDISNKITYKGLMIQGKKFDRGTLPMSEWIDVVSPLNDSHWIEDEGIRAVELIRELCQEHKIEENDIYMISPFRDVVRGLTTLFKKEKLLQPKSKKDKRIGTIHTVQGKESKVVILVLGSDPENNGARQWASDKPNLLNVAVTRAKERLYIIGNKNNWKDKPYFSDALELLSFDPIAISYNEEELVKELEMMKSL